MPAPKPRPVRVPAREVSCSRRPRMSQAPPDPPVKPPIAPPAMGPMTAGWLPSNAVSQRTNRHARGGTEEDRQPLARGDLAAVQLLLALLLLRFFGLLGLVAVLGEGETREGHHGEERQGDEGGAHDRGAYQTRTFPRSGLHATASGSGAAPIHMSDSLVSELKSLIVRELNLEGRDPASIVDSAPLFGEGLGLGSARRPPAGHGRRGAIRRAHPRG